MSLKSGLRRMLHPINARFLVRSMLEIVRECCECLQTEYFGTKTRLNCQDHSLGLKKYFRTNCSGV